MPLGSVNGQPESLIYQTGPYKNVRVQFAVCNLKAWQSNRVGEAAAWSRAVSHRLIIQLTVHRAHRTPGALPLRSLCATAGSQRVIRRAERCNPNKEEKRKKNEQPEELEAFTINYLQLLL